MRQHSLRRPWRPLILLLLAAVIGLAIGMTSRGHAAAPRVHAVARTANPVHSPLVIGLSQGAGGWGGASTAHRLNLIKRLTQTKWVRDNFSWSAIEPRPNRFSFRYYDHYMLALARRGMRVIPQLYGTPRWVSPGGEFAIPADPRSYASYVAAVFRRWGVHGTFWRAHPKLRGSAVTAVELWNEPYFDSGNAGRYDPGRYARLVKAAGIAAHAADRSAKVLMEAEMEPHHYNVWRWWVDSLYRAVPDLNRYFDGVSQHDFGTDLSHLSAVRADQPYPNFNRVRRIEDLRRQFVRHHAANKPFWIMEAGWSTCTERNIDCVTVPQQGADLQTFYGYLPHRWSGFVQAAFIYRFDDGPDGNTVQQGYGLVRHDDSAKPALAVFRAMSAASRG